MVCQWKALRNRQQGLLVCEWIARGIRQQGWCVNGKHLEIDSWGYVVCERKALRNIQLGLCGV